LGNNNLSIGVSDYLLMNKNSCLLYMFGLCAKKTAIFFTCLDNCANGFDGLETIDIFVIAMIDKQPRQFRIQIKITFSYFDSIEQHIVRNH